MKYLYISAFLFTAICILLISCEKNKLTTAPFELVDGKALVKINYSCPYAKNPAVIIKVNGEKVSSAITYSTPYPGGGLNTGGNTFADYLSLPAGDDTVSISIPYVGTGIDSILLHKAVYNVKPNVYQTIHFTDTLEKTLGVITTDASVKPDSGRTQFRFVNLIPNSTGIDLYFGPTKVASNIAYKQATDTFTLTANISLPWTIRRAGESVRVGSTYSSTSSTANQRVFTVYSRGYLGLDSPNVISPKVSFAYNK